MGPYKTMTETWEKGKLRESITNYLKEIDPEKSIIGLAIHGLIQHDFNFENLITMLKSQYEDNPSGMIEVVGEIPMRLILKW
jgi:hypothetical protein